MIVPPGGSTRLEITFDPSTHHEGSTWLTLASSAGTAEVDLRGRGLAPVLSVEPTHDLTWTPTGCASVQHVTLTNTGSEELDVEGLELDTTSAEPTLGDESLPRTVDLGGELAIPLIYEPLDTYGDSAWLRITSSDPRDPEVVVTATARGTDEALHRETHEVPPTIPVDVLWTLDRSCGP